MCLSLHKQWAPTEQIERDSVMKTRIVFRSQNEDYSGLEKPFILKADFLLIGLTVRKPAQRTPDNKVETIV